MNSWRWWRNDSVKIASSANFAISAVNVFLPADSWAYPYLGKPFYNRCNTCMLWASFRKNKQQNDEPPQLVRFVLCVSPANFAISAVNAFLPAEFLSLPLPGKTLLQSLQHLHAVGIGLQKNKQQNGESPQLVWFVLCVFSANFAISAVNAFLPAEFLSSPLPGKPFYNRCNTCILWASSFRKINNRMVNPHN
jgi:hypothetical protein